MGVENKATGTKNVMITECLHLFSSPKKIIIRHCSLEVDPSILVGSFLVGILPYGPFPWKRSYAAYFLFSMLGLDRTGPVPVKHPWICCNLK